MNSPSERPRALSLWKTELVADLARVAARDRWGRIFMAIGWIHLSIFLICQWRYTLGDRDKIHFLSLWGLEFAANLWVFRRIAGPGWFRASPLIIVLVRVWATFLILSFNLASLNTLTGWTLDWFKPVWTTLSTFGFATTAYLTTLWFFVPAVQMYFTGLIMVVNPEWQYLIYGISWWLTLEVLGFLLERKRFRTFASVVPDAKSLAASEELVA